GLNKFLLLYIGAPSVIFVILGGYLSKIVKSDYLEVFLGVFLIVLALLFLIKKNLVFKADKKESIIGGSLSGLTAGLLGTGGAIRGLTMAAFNLEKSVFIATSAFIDLMIDASRTVVYYQNGYIENEELKYVPFLFVIGLVGTFIGKKILNYIPQQKFKIISLILILVIGIFTLVNFYILK
ncbi:MAG: sulfite exporter TauE/SafE family protein, partial [Flavobacteriaceae bacterium]|nr:sulfite exporter TauE/SafE family protein [Flavobacteriaceae bacterium]